MPGAYGGNGASSLPSSATARQTAGLPNQAISGSPLSFHPQQGQLDGRGFALPLNIIGMIVSYVRALPMSSDATELT